MLDARGEGEGRGYRFAIQYYILKESLKYKLYLGSFEKI